MTRNPGRSSQTDRLRRRRFLALSGSLGLASLAGCLNQLPGSGPKTIDGDALAELVENDAPTVSETLPVDIEASFVDEQRAAAESKLDDVPAPFGEHQIPNGVIRERLNREFDSAHESLRSIPDAETPYERLGRATRARTSAHEVVTAWRAIESEITVDDLRESRSAVGDDVDAFVSRWSYVGDDPARAAVVHAEIEREIRGARNWLSFRESVLDRAADNVLDLADLAVDVERARVGVTVASYFFDRFRDRLDGPSDRRDRLASAREELLDRVETRAETLPSEDVEDPTSLVDRDVGRTAGVRALSELASEARYRVQDVIAEGDDFRVASDVLSATRVLSSLRAFENLRDRLEDGDDVAVEGVEDVRSLRTDAIEAVDAARDAERARLVTDAVLPGFAREIRWIDDRFENRSGSVPLDSVAHDAAQYVVAAATCRAVVPVSADVTTVLRQS